MGTGILWNLSDIDQDGYHAQCSDATGAADSDCAKNWWKNVLFVQNFVDDDAEARLCFGHTWYLGVDMQVYLTTPLVCLAYYLNRWSTASTYFPRQ